MEDYKNIRIEDYTYQLPDDRIAKYPKERRDESKLLHFTNEAINSFEFKHLPELLEEDDLLVFNNAKVIQARLAFKKETGAKIEIFCLEPHKPADYNLAFQAKGQSEWKCMVGNLKKWKTGSLYKNIGINGHSYRVEAQKVDSFENAVIVKFIWKSLDKENSNELSFGDILENIGNTPLPPYLNRKVEKEDKDRYQTIYAKQKGSVAAPTAGLHFTDNVLSNLEKKGIQTQQITLHVSAGTFRPVKSETIEGHDMHEEHFEISLNCINNLLKRKGRIVAVGTTSVRTLESLYWIGVKLISKEEDAFSISQWEVYNKGEQTTLNEALEAIKSYIEKEELDIIQAVTRIIIVPGYKFKVIKGLVTNFHQPQSTLLLLIAAIVGLKWKEIYNYALDNNYRFLSYGDSSFLEM